MATGRPKRPTDAELIILRVLWEHGPSTVREVNRILNETRPTGYTTTLKQMQVMTSKGLLVRDESRRPQVYRNALSQDQTQRQLVGPNGLEVSIRRSQQPFGRSPMSLRKFTKSCQRATQFPELFIQRQVP